MARWSVDLVPAERADWSAISRLPGGGQLSCQPQLQRFYSGAGVVTVHADHALAAAWPVPLMRNTDGSAITRPYRALPYTHILFGAAHPKRMREAIACVADWCADQLDSVAVPLGPDDTTLGPFAVAGMLIEWRHTYVLDTQDPPSKRLSASARNHLNHAAQTVDVVIHTGPGEFTADRAIVDEGDGAKAIRTDLARSLLASGCAVVVRAAQSGTVVGEYFLAWDDRRAYLLHSWFEREGPRGIPTLLMVKTWEWVREHLPVRTLDLEGSVIEGVDRYFSSFGARPVPYGFLHWHRSPSELVRDVLETVDRGPHLRGAAPTGGSR